MGADFIGWRNCRLQAELGQDGFLGKLKLRAYKAAIEQQVPEDRWEAVEVLVRVTGRPDRVLRYGTISMELAAFERGIPECAACPLSDGKALGCYRYVTYPVDAAAERLMFEFFAKGVEESGSIVEQLYRDVISQIDEESGWYRNRGGEGTLAELDMPLVHKWGRGRTQDRIDSAQVIAAMFISLEDPTLVVAYARLWIELFEYIDHKLREAGVQLLGDVLEIHVDGGSDPQAGSIAVQAVSSLELAREISQSRTLQELRHVASMVAASVEGALEEGWTVVIDG